MVSRRSGEKRAVRSHCPPCAWRALGLTVQSRCSASTILLPCSVPCSRGRVGARRRRGWRRQRPTATSRTSKRQGACRWPGPRGTGAGAGAGGADDWSRGIFRNSGNAGPPLRCNVFHSEDGQLSELTLWPAPRYNARNKARAAPAEHRWTPLTSFAGTGGVRVSGAITLGLRSKYKVPADLTTRGAFAPTSPQPRAAPAGRRSIAARHRNGWRHQHADQRLGELEQDGSPPSQQQHAFCVQLHRDSATRTHTASPACLAQQEEAYDTAGESKRPVGQGFGAPV